MAWTMHKEQIMQSYCSFESWQAFF